MLLHIIRQLVIQRIIFIGVNFLVCKYGLTDFMQAKAREKESLIESARIVGGWAAGYAGAEIGVSIGAVAGPVGALAGGLIGGFLGYISGGYAAKSIYHYFQYGFY